MSLAATYEGKLMFPSDYLSAVELQGKDCPVEIESISNPELRLEGGATAKRWTIGFKGKQKKFVLNKTNAKTIIKLHGNEAKSWIGKTVVLYPTKCKLKGETVDCIRIRDKVNA